MHFFTLEAYIVTYCFENKFWWSGNTKICNFDNSKNFVKSTLLPLTIVHELELQCFGIALSLIWCIYKKLWWWSNTLNSLRENLIELEEEVVPYTMHFLEWSIGTFLLWITKKTLLNTSNMSCKIDIFDHQFHFKQPIISNLGNAKLQMVSVIKSSFENITH